MAILFALLKWLFIPSAVPPLYANVLVPACSVWASCTVTTRPLTRTGPDADAQAIALLAPFSVAIKLTVCSHARPVESAGSVPPLVSTTVGVPALVVCAYFPALPEEPPIVMVTTSPLPAVVAVMLFVVVSAPVRSVFPTTIRLPPTVAFVPIVAAPLIAAVAACRKVVRVSESKVGPPNGLSNWPSAAVISDVVSVTAPVLVLKLMTKVAGRIGSIRPCAPHVTGAGNPPPDRVTS